MSNFDIIKKKIKLIIFDQYGTIVDMQKGLTEAVIPFLKKKKWEGDPNRFVTWWRRTHFENSMKQFETTFEKQFETMFS